MPRVFNQKIKILYLMRVFLERTDEEHPMSVKELIIYLNSLGISAERKTVYDDIETFWNGHSESQRAAGRLLCGQPEI